MNSLQRLCMLTYRANYSFISLISFSEISVNRWVEQKSAQTFNILYLRCYKALQCECVYSAIKISFRTFFPPY